MHLIVWEFRVNEDSHPAFEAAYGAQGPWSALFGRAEGFVGTDLVRCDEEPGRYLTLDRWTSARAFSDFQQDFGDAYRALDLELEGMAVSEDRIGAFDVVA